jgi:3-methyladenine DNA glycosylase Tag
MEAPKQIKPKSLADYLEVMSKVAFQSGMSWAIVENKWEGTREAFLGFDPIKVASLTTKQIDALAGDTRLIRNRRKIEGVVHNARTMIELEEQYGAFKKYLRSHESFEPLVKDMRKRFKFLGDFGAFYFLYVVGEPVPEYEVWCASRGRTPMTATRA